jgi:5-hydroxyisourate hydrolase
MPASGIRVSLYRRAGTEERLVGEGTTDGDGRIRRLLAENLTAGVYRLVFDLAGSIAPAEGGTPSFFKSLSVDLHVSDTSRNHHVPLLLAPYSLTTYRGS